MNIFQIYYEPSQLKRLEWKPVFNPDLTVYFENDVILRLAAQGRLFEGAAPYAGVLSHRFREKGSNRSVKMEKAVEMLDKYPVVSFFPAFQRKIPPRHDPWSPAMHRLNDELGFKGRGQSLLEGIGQPFPRRIDASRIIYSNAFLARRKVWRRYLTDYLRPARVFMEENPGMFWVDANYHKASKLKDRLLAETGVPYYTLHTFVMERLFSTFCQNEKLRVCQTK